jgi:hypothetical protein
MSSLLPTAQYARPLVWWTGAHLDVVCIQLVKACSAWTHDWAGDEAVSDAHGVQAYERPRCESQSWIPLGTRGEAAAWVQTSADPVTDVFKTLFGADQSAVAMPSAGVEGIGQAVASRAWTSLMETLRCALALDPNPVQADPDPVSFKPWSGYAVISLAGVGRLPLALLLNAACVGAALDPQCDSFGPRDPRQKPRASLAPLDHALAGRKLRLRVELSSCELDLGSLEGLRIGDIVPLPHALDAPLLVSTVQDVQVCLGFLGRQAHYKAIELTREAPAEREAQIDHHTKSEV